MTRLSLIGCTMGSWCHQALKVQSDIVLYLIVYANVPYYYIQIYITEREDYMMAKEIFKTLYT